MSVPAQRSLAYFLVGEHTESMNTKTTFALALAAGFLGGIVSQRVVPAPVFAQQLVPVHQDIRSRRFVLADEAGVSRGIFGFDKNQRPSIEMMDANGHTWGFTPLPFSQGEMLPDATCQTCSVKPAGK
jgi:hypothetical protein